MAKAAAGGKQADAKLFDEFKKLGDVFEDQVRRLSVKQLVSVHEQKIKQSTEVQTSSSKTREEMEELLKKVKSLVKNYEAAVKAGKTDQKTLDELRALNAELKKKSKELGAILGDPEKKEGDDKKEGEEKKDAPKEEPKPAEKAPEPAAPAATPAPAPAAEPEKPKKKSAAPIIILLVSLVIVGGLGAVFLLQPPPPPPPKPTSIFSSKPAEPEPPKVVMPDLTQIFKPKKEPEPEPPIWKHPAAMAAAATLVVGVIATGALLASRPKSKGGDEKPKVGPYGELLKADGTPYGRTQIRTKDEGDVMTTHRIKDRRNTPKKTEESTEDDE